MERTVLIILTLITTVLRGQTNNQVLKNLSYHVVGVIGNKEQIGGTGFFIKKGTAFYLVSAWHSFSFKDHLTQKSTNDNTQSIKEIIVYRNLADIRTDNYSRINLINSVTQQPTYLSIYQDDSLLDISAIQVNRQSPFEFDYYEVDNIDKEVKAKINGEVFYYGFPIRNGRQSDNAEYFEGKTSGANLERKELVVDIVGQTGCSGAPLFFKSGQREYLWGVLFYALKDNTGRAERCKAVNLNSLIERL